MLELLYTSGIRAAELLGLNVSDVDLRQGTALVMGKGRKQRVVPIGKTARRFLEGYLAAVRPHLARNPAERALFLDERGRRYPYHRLRRFMRVCADRARLEGQVTPHTFRRSCTTEMLRAGAGMYHLKELLGHESLDTLQHYARLTIVDLKKTHQMCHPRERDEGPNQSLRPEDDAGELS
jgi:site-specific recombinase XerD